ncbi:MAG: alpha/beta hydrolase family protein [Actinomycetes bacterium]
MRWVAFGAVLAVGVGLAAPAGASRPTRTPLGQPVYAKPGPYRTGVTTIALSDRKIEVFYPARAGSTKGEPRATYLQTDPIPPEVLAGLPKPPPGTDLSVTIPAYRNVAVAPGRFPLVMFSHGAGGWRGVYGYPLSGLASWGFVVASVDFTEYGLLSQFTGGGNTADRAAKVSVAVGAAIDRMVAADRGARSRLRGHIDTRRIAGVGHSAGGGTMFGLLDDPRIDAIVGWAPVGPKPPITSDTPTMIIAGSTDIAITPAAAQASYAALLPPKRYVEIGTMGHNAFSDACLAIRNGTDLIGIAKNLGIGIPDRLLELGRNGCDAQSLDTKRGWRIIQHFTVAELRSALRINRVPIGLGPGIATAFPGVTIDYRQQLR